MSTYKFRSLSPSEEPGTQSAQRDLLDLLESKVWKSHTNENGVNGTTQQIVPVAQPSIKPPSLTKILEDIRNDALLYEAKTSNEPVTGFQSQSILSQYPLPRSSQINRPMLSLGQEATPSSSSPQSKDVEFWECYSSKEASTSKKEPETQIPLSSSTCLQRKETDKTISSSEYFKLIQEMLLSIFNSDKELPNGDAVEANECIQSLTTSQVTEKNESFKPEALEISHDPTLVENKVEIASSGPIYFFTDETNEYVTEIASSDPICFLTDEYDGDITEIPSSDPIYKIKQDITSYEQLPSLPLQFLGTSTPKADAAKRNGSKSNGLIQQTASPTIPSQITLPSSQLNYARAVLSENAIQSTSGTSSSNSTFVRKASNKFVIPANVLSNSSAANVQAQSSNVRMSSKESSFIRTQNPKTYTRKPTNQVALQSKLKKNVNVPIHPYFGKQKLNESSRNTATSKPTTKTERKTDSTRPALSNTLIKCNGSMKQPKSEVKPKLNLPPKERFYAEVPQDCAGDHTLQKYKTKKAVQCEKLLQPFPKSTDNCDPKKTSSKRKLNEIVSPMIPFKKRLLQEDVGVKITRMHDNSSDMPFSLPEISVERFRMVGGVEQKVGVPGINVNTSLEPISKNETVSESAEKLLKNNVSVVKLPSKPVDKALSTYLEILKRNNVSVVKFNKK